MGIISLFTMNDSSMEWRIITPIVLFGIAAGTFLYELSKRKG